MNQAFSDSYNFNLVIISIIIAIIASYTMLNLAGRVAKGKGLVRVTWLFGGAISMGFGIWSMHFIGMLAFKAPVAISYDLLIVSVSILPAIAASGIALFLVSRPTIGFVQLMGGSLCMGLGIAFMHYFGMTAIKVPLTIEYNPKLVVLSLAIAITVSLIALFLAFHLRSECIPWYALKQMVASIFMGMAVPTMHYTGMLAFHFIPDSKIEISEIPSSTKDANFLAIAVSLGTIIILGLALLTIFFDRRISAEENIRRQLQTILEAIKVGVLVTGGESEIYTNNQAILNLLGVTKEQLQQQWKDYIDNINTNVVSEYKSSNINSVFEAIAKNQSLSNLVISFHHSITENKTWLLVNAVPIENNESQLTQVIYTFSDITELKQKEEALVESETKNRILAEIATNQAQQLSKTIEELKLTQTQLVQQEKMSSLGRMVAGIAHEVNNPVTFIHVNLTHARAYIKDLVGLLKLYRIQYPIPTPEIQKFIEEIEFDYITSDLKQLFSSMEIGTNRIRDIVLSLRNFSRLDEAQMKPVDIHEGLDNTLLLLRHRLKANSQFPEIIICKNYDILPLINCYPGQLNQAFMNILENAIDVLRKTSQFCQMNFERKNLTNCIGKLIEKTKIPPIIYISTQFIEKSRVKISILNNGPTIPESIRDQIFDPFFTTKPVGQGTGLGLSISYQVIVKHGGTLKCISEPKAGVEFQIEIPV